MSNRSGHRGRPGGIASGVVMLVFTAILWGLTFPIAKPAVVGMDPFWLSAIRYTFVPVILVVVLIATEGRRALDYEGRFARAALIGGIGIAGYNTGAFVGLRYTSPEHTALISALQTVFVTLAVWLFQGRRPKAYTLAAIVVAFVGLLLVVTRGEPLAALGSGRLLGDILVLGGVLTWVVYVLGVPQFPGWSALRFTALTSIPGGIATIAVALLATGAGLAEVPPPADPLRYGFEIAYLSLGTAIAAVLAWNGGIARLGPVNAALFAALVPVVTFTARALAGERYVTAEMVGAALVIGALVANNLLARRGT